MASTKGTPSDPSRDAWRRGWISREQRDELAAKSAGQGITGMDALRESGLLDAGNLARLFGAEALPGGVLEEGIVEEEPLHVGNVIAGTFRIFGIAEGGFGRVFLCTHIETGQEYALKTPRRIHLCNPALVRNFRAEARRWIELGFHPHLVRAHGVGEHGSLIFLVLEYVKGGRTLADEIVAGRSDWRSLLRVACGIAEALCYTGRAAGLIHGDIKPLNILLAPDGVAKLTDFGISYARLREKDENSLAGTPGYLAPELVAGKPRSATTDVFAFGRTLWQGVTGRVPLPVDPLAVVEDVRAIAPGVPEPFARLIMDCMQADPGKRPVDFETLRADLQRLHRELAGEYFQMPANLPPEITDRHEAARHAYNLSDSAIALGDFSQALDLARRAIELDAGYWLGHDALGRACEGLGRHPEAAVAFAAAIRLNPDDASLRAQLAKAQGNARNHDLARDSLNEALKLANTHSKAGDLDRFSWLIVQLLPPETALAWLDEIVAAKPHASHTWVNRTALLRMLDRSEEALASARQAVNLNPSSGFAWAALAGALLDAEHQGDALDAIDRAIAQEGGQASFYAQKCVILAGLGMDREAQETFKTAIRRWPEAAELRALM
jgi:tetratricopeptide (TPR) repeat protein